MSTLTVAYDALPFARWRPLFHLVCVEHPGLELRWRAVGFPRHDRSLLEGADVGLFVAPPPEDGLDALTIETSQMLVAMAVGHPLARRDELRVADILDEPFPDASELHPTWGAFWTLDDRRGGPPKQVGEPVAAAQDGLDVVAAGRAIATVPATIASGLAHPGVVAVPLVDGPPVETRLVWRSDDHDPIVRSLVGLAGDMTRDVRGPHGDRP